MAITDKQPWSALSRKFRARRNVALGEMISEMRSPRILDVGGHPDFWETVPFADSAAEIVVVNSEAGEHASMAEMQSGNVPSNMSISIGDACDLQYQTDEFDLVVCNSVLEHVSGWPNVERAAAELIRVGKRGWVQTPAHEFPLEVHYMRPFVHWVGEPARAKLLRLSVKRFSDYSPAEFRNMFLFVQLLTRREMEFLFPSADIRSERFLGLTKSHIVTW